MEYVSTQTTTSRPKKKKKKAGASSSLYAAAKTNHHNLKFKGFGWERSLFSSLNQSQFVWNVQMDQYSGLDDEQKINWEYLSTLKWDILDEKKNYFDQKYENSFTVVFLFCYDNCSLKFALNFFNRHKWMLCNTKFCYVNYFNYQ